MNEPSENDAMRTNRAVGTIRDGGDMSETPGEYIARNVRGWDLADVYVEVCLRAERNMAKTGTVSGAHWNAFRQLLQEAGVLEDAERDLEQARKDDTRAERRRGIEYAELHGEEWIRAKRVKGWGQ